jgi:hypothetical protein
MTVPEASDARRFERPAGAAIPSPHRGVRATTGRPGIEA